MSSPFGALGVTLRARPAASAAGLVPHFRESPTAYSLEYYNIVCCTACDAAGGRSRAAIRSDRSQGRESARRNRVEYSEAEFPAGTLKPVSRQILDESQPGMKPEKDKNIVAEFAGVGT